MSAALADGIDSKVVMLDEEIAVSYRWYFCAALQFLHLHSPDCEHCSVMDCMGVAMRRLRELNEHAQQVSAESWGKANARNDHAA